MDQVPAVEASVLAFQTSPQTDKLIAALAKAQGEIEDAAKDAENPHFKSSYADLASVWRACRAPLSKHGIAIVQIPLTGSAPGRIGLLTRVAHADQWMQSGLELPVAQPTAHAYGSALTYLRRYTLMAFASVAPADEPGEDDGNAASGKVEPPKPEPKVQRPSPVKPKTAKPEPEHDPNFDDLPDPIPSNPTNAQLARLFTIAAQAKWTNDQVKMYLETRWTIDSTSKLTMPQYNEMCELMQKTTFPRACTAIAIDNQNAGGAN